MSIAEAHLDYFRSEWAQRLVDSVVVSEQTGAAFDPGTGEITPTFSEVYNGAALVRPTTAGEAEFGEATMATFDYMVMIPDTETGVEPGHIVTVTSTHDGALDGLQLVVSNVNRDTYMTIRRLDCMEVQDAG